MTSTGRPAQPTPWRSQPPCARATGERHLAALVSPRASGKAKSLKLPTPFRSNGNEQSRSDDSDPGRSLVTVRVAGSPLLIP